MGDFFNPFESLGAAAGKLLVDTWTAAMLALWNAGLWILRLAFTFTDALLTPDLSETGPGAALYQTTFWIAGALLVIMLLIQLGVAVTKRDGHGLARIAIGIGQFVVVWGGWIAYGVLLVTAAGGLTRSLMQSLLKTSTWAAWQPWTPFTASDVTDAGVATVLGLMGLLLWLAAIGNFLVLLVRAASLMVLIATTPIAAAGLVSDAGRAWFWKSLRWFHAAALTPVVMVLVIGVGIKFTSGVALGLTGVQGAIGTAVPGVLLICVATVSPLALFKLLAFVDPATTSGASMRASMAAFGGIQGLLAGKTAAGGNQAATTDEQGRSIGEDGANDATTDRFNTAVAQGASRFGPIGELAGRGIGLITAAGTTGATLGADITNQMGAGHNTYPPDFTRNGRRATHQNNQTNTNDGNQPDSSEVPPDNTPPTPEPQLATPNTNNPPPTPTSPVPVGGAPAATSGGGGAAAAGEISAADAAVLIV